MAKLGSFPPELLAEFKESLAERYDFATCQRPDGSTYGTSGKCRQGVEISKISTGYFRVTDASGANVGVIMAQDAFAGGGGIREAGKQSRYTVKVKDKKRENLTLAQAKAWAKEQLGEKAKGDAKVAIKGALTPKGKAKRLENIKEQISEARDDFNSQVDKWNAIPREQRKNYPGLKKNIEFLKTKLETLQADRQMILDTPVAD